MLGRLSLKSLNSYSGRLVVFFSCWKCDFNPAAKAGNMGSEEHKEMLFWTKEEYKKFSFEMMDKPVSFYAFEMLYWCGIREGELLALTAADFDFEKETVRINKSYQRLHGEDVITTPKTKKSNRIIKMPKFLCEEMQEYLGMIYGLKKKDRIFTVTKSYLHHEMDRGAEAAGVDVYKRQRRDHSVPRDALRSYYDRLCTATLCDRARACRVSYTLPRATGLFH